VKALGIGLSSNGPRNCITEKRDLILNRDKRSHFNLYGV
jgi:hypothetical protein